MAWRWLAHLGGLISLDGVALFPNTFVCPEYLRRDLQTSSRTAEECPRPACPVPPLRTRLSLRTLPLAAVELGERGVTGGVVHSEREGDVRGLTPRVGRLLPLRGDRRRLPPRTLAGPGL